MAKAKIDWDKHKAEILSRLDIKAECEKFGIQFTGGTSASGWAPCLNPYKPEQHASCGVQIGSGPQRGYLVMFNINPGSSSAVSFWDMARDFHPSLSGCEFKEIQGHYAAQVGVKAQGESPPPTMDDVKNFQKAISSEVREYLHKIRGLTDESIEKYEIGWDQNQQRVTFPVYDSHRRLVNIRFHAWKKEQTPKTLNWSGHGEKRLWGVDRLAADDGDVVAVCEGEFDAQLVEQTSGILAVSPTNGNQAFDAEWVRFFHGKNVVLVWDCDEPGRDAVVKKVVPAFRPAVRSGEILSLKIVWLFDDSKNKAMKDYTDFVVKAGGTGEALRQMVEQTKPKTFPKEVCTLPEPIVLKSFKQIDDDQFVGKRITFPLYIHGENSEAYHSPTKVVVGECPGKKKFGCHGRDDWAYSCDEPLYVKTGDRIQLACVSMNDFQLKSYLREYVCDKGQKCNITIGEEDRTTIRELYAHQVIAGGADAALELVEKPVYTIGGKLYPIGQYQATGYVHSHPKNQRPTMLIDTMERMEEDWQQFDLEKAKPLLRELKALDIDEFLDDLMYNHTRIYKRYDLHLGVLLTMCSPRWINLPDDGLVRGWISSVVIGDTGCGKTKVPETMFKLANVGCRISGMTSSRTGITYACEYDEKRGWRIKAGALLKMTGQAILIDEAQDLLEGDLKTMAEALDRGRLKIDRIQNKEFEAETRCFFSCNPRDPERRANQRTMSSYKYGCLSIADIFPRMMLRRIDLALFTTSHDIKNIEAILESVPDVSVKSTTTKENFRALVHYAWNLHEDQIQISESISKLIRSESSKLSRRFGGCEDIPLVYPQDFRTTFARLCVALAVADLSTDDDFETIKVTMDHVHYMSDKIAEWYSAANCQLDVYAGQYVKQNVLSEEDAIIERLAQHIRDVRADGRKERLATIWEELMSLTPDGQAKLSQSYLKELFGVDRRTIFNDMQPLLFDRLVISSRGYAPTTKMIQLNHYLESNKVGLFK